MVDYDIAQQVYGKERHKAIDVLLLIYEQGSTIYHWEVFYD